MRVMVTARVRVSFRVRVDGLGFWVLGCGFKG